MYLPASPWAPVRNKITSMLVQNGSWDGVCVKI